MHTALVGQVRLAESLDADGCVAFDDQTSTFIIPSGGGFRVVFCPTGRSSTILSTMASQLHQLSQTGHVTPQLVADSMNIRVLRNSGFPSTVRGRKLLLMLAATAAFFMWF